MIMLCERCYAPIEAGEPVLRLAHIDHAHPDGRISWRHSFLHTALCPAHRSPPPPRPDTGAWNPSRGVAARRR